MNALYRLPWFDMLIPKLSWGEKAIRPLLVYGTLFLIFRVSTKRGMAQATMFDFLILLLISNVVQNAMIGDDNSILGGALGAVTLVALCSGLNYLTARSRRARVLLEGQPVLLIEHGCIDEARLRQQNVSRNDLLAAIRKQGLIRLADVGFAVLELDGTISVIKADDDHRPHDCLPIEIAGDESAESAQEPVPGGQPLQHRHDATLLR